MASSPREIVYQALNFQDPPRAPQQLWHLPWAEMYHPRELAAIQEAFPPDIAGAPTILREAPHTEGEIHRKGRFVDEWGCFFENIQDGVIGEVKDPIVRDWDSDAGRVHIPREWLTFDRDAANRFCAESDRFVLSGCLARPFERLQFLRGTADLMMDLLIEPPAMLRFIDEMHAFYCELFEAWAATDVDALMFMDDWGSQQSLLIAPDVWERHFKPRYRDYVEIAHGAGKKIFMHSDGHILAIYPHLIELGVDAVNSQLFCMGLDQLERFAGHITFWGEIDRQHLLPGATTAEIDQAVREVHQHLWRNGGCIAQCEFGAGAKPENVRQVFQTWGVITQQ